MPIPKHNEIRLPVLRYLSDGLARRSREMEKPLGELMGLSAEEMTTMYDSGNGPIFLDRLSWALSYLSMAGLVSKPRRGVYQINDKGRELLERPDDLEDYVESQVAKRPKGQGQLRDFKVKNPSALEIKDQTPDESLYASYEGIKASIYAEIIDTILSKSPQAFEHLVVQLLQLMGYGGQVKDPGAVTQYGNDGGIDGIIKEDVLGFGQIHIQAKRYAPNNTISRPEIQKFVGALAVAQSNKGVFITTSSFSQGAIDYVESLNATTNVVLIDGQDLAKYIYEYELGMQVEKRIEIKKLDGDYWDGLEEG